MRRERRPARRYFINTNELHQVHRRARNSQNTQASDDTAALMKGIKDSDVPEDGRRLSLCFSEREREPSSSSPGGRNRCFGKGGERTGRVRPRSKEKIKRATWGSSHRDICRDFESETEGIAYHSRETGRERPSSNRRFDFHRTSPRPWPAKFNSLSSRDGKEKATAVESPMPLLV